MRITSVSLLVAVFFASSALAQDRPHPYPVIPDADFEAALEAGTRSPDGKPGPAYWTNTATYDIDASFSPVTGRLRGTQKAVYRNNSPDPLTKVVVHLRQNVHAPGVVRNRNVQVTDGMPVTHVSVNGTPLLEVTERGRRAGYFIDGTLMTIRLAEALDPGAEATFDFSWSFELAEENRFREGSDGDVYYMAYWYPQFAVYDDLHGWKADPYMGAGEFYMGYADYDVRLTLPQGMLVGATGVLQNPEDVLSEQTIARMDAARNNPEYIIRVVDEDDRRPGTSTATSPSAALTWHFQAENVRDFAWGTSGSYVWDMTIADVGDRNGDGQPDTAEIHSFWRTSAPAWLRSAEFTDFSIEHLSKTFFPYPYPHMTAMEGIIGGGMEYPMMTLIGRSSSDRRLFGTPLREVAHMYFPMIVGQDEKEDTWMDEGLTSCNTTEGANVFWEEEGWRPELQSYYTIAGTADERPSRRHADQYPIGTSARGTAAYNKPAVSLNALRGILGNDLFYRAYREYAERWSYRHPVPEDLFNTFEDVVGQDLDWFWTTMFYTTWTLDQGVASVNETGSGVEISIVDHGLSPFPVPLRITYADGVTQDVMLPVEPWLSGARTQTGTFPAGTVTRVEIDPDMFLPDVDRSNNVWMRD
jgi:hypothetical protein